MASSRSQRIEELQRAVSAELLAAADPEERAALLVDEETAPASAAAGGPRQIGPYRLVSRRALAATPESRWWSELQHVLRRT